MIERPILFSAPMVRAILDGSKTQTRRIVKPQPPFGCSYAINGAFNHALCFQTEHGANSSAAVWVPPTPKSTDHRLPCPYSGIGNRLWVRETWRAGKGYDGLAPRDIPKNPRVVKLWYEADNSTRDEAGKVRQSIFMLRWASRITLEITGLRVERLQDISEEDAKAEGVRISDAIESYHEDKIPPFMGHVPAYNKLWESINGKGSWSKNPWVWVITFERITP